MSFELGNRLLVGTASTEIGGMDRAWALIKMVGPYALPAILLWLLVRWYVWRRFRTSATTRRILSTGSPATATVLEVLDRKITVNKNPLLRLRLTVEPQDRASYEVSVDFVAPRIDFPRVGDRLPIKYDPQNPGQVVVVSQSERRA